jgi:hypothetical protein
LFVLWRGKSSIKTGTTGLSYSQKFPETLILNPGL